MDPFVIIGYKVRKDDENETVYFKHLGDTEFSVCLNKENMDIEKFANDFRKKVMIKPDKEDIEALKELKKNNNL